MKKLFIVYASLCVLTAVYHIIGIFVKVNNSSPTRHLAFAVIAGTMAYWLIKRPKFLPYLFACLLSQQLYSHGKDVYKLWIQKTEIDWIGIGVVLIMPCIFITILFDKKAHRMNKQA